jgi:predicted nucleic acid-binding protein
LAVILDTNALSAFFENEGAVVSLMSEVEAVHLPVIVLGEYRFGLRGSRLRKILEPKLVAFARTCTVLAVLESTTNAYARIRHDLKKAGTPIPENDIWIAALALEYHLDILSNDRHFDAIDHIRRVGWHA